MPMELLRHIATQPLPLNLSEPADIDKLSVLRAADLVAAFIPSAAELAVEPLAMPARVLAITPQGREALARPSS